MANNDNKYTQSKREQIELRSGNTRRFIDEEPPFIIRYGTIVIILLLLLFASIAYFVFLENRKMG